jgi:AraC-like DNA-binding protein
MKTGRKIAIVSDAQIIERICDLFRQGCSVKTVCECAGLSQSSFFDYLRRANSDAPDDDPVFAEFAERVTRARGEGKARLVELVNQGAAHDWRAAIALLERIAPSEYGRTATPSPDIRVKLDTDTVAELLRREITAVNPDLEKIARLKFVLSEIRAANQTLTGMLADWDMDAFSEACFKPFVSRP